MSSLEDQKLPEPEIQSMDDMAKTASANQGTVQDLQLDPAMERDTLRRFDLFLLPQIAILIIIGYLDRSNVGEELSLSSACIHVVLLGRVQLSQCDVVVVAAFPCLRATVLQETR